MTVHMITDGRQSLSVTKKEKNGCSLRIVRTLKFGFWPKPKQLQTAVKVVC